MGEVVCTLIVNGKQTDLVLPDNVPVHLLSRSICSALKLPVNENQPLELYLVENSGDMLIRSSRTLSQAKLINGSFCVWFSRRQIIKRQLTCWVQGISSFSFIPRIRLGDPTRLLIKILTSVRWI